MLESCQSGSVSGDPVHIQFHPLDEQDLLACVEVALQRKRREGADASRSRWVDLEWSPELNALVVLAMARAGDGASVVLLSRLPFALALVNACECCCVCLFRRSASLPTHSSPLPLSSLVHPSCITQTKVAKA